MWKREAWLRLLVLGGIIAIAAAAACGDRRGDAGLVTGAGSAGNDSLPGDSVPEDSTPPDTVPGDSVPSDSVPRDSVPRDSVPRDSVPPDTTRGRVASITVAPTSQEVLVGDSGSVAATLRDRAGNFVQDDTNIIWELSDSTVLAITHGGTGHSFVVFRALRAGYARFTARYSTLSDTGVVLVRDSMPGDSTPGVASITVTPDSQRVAEGESGQVWAALHDAVGGRVYDPNILWALSDSAVLRITQGGSGSPYVLFEALRVGRATLTARYGTLTDTGLVVVDSVPDDSVPPDTLPGPAASITVHPDSIQAAVGDSGWMTATLRDSVGREVRDTAGVIEWTVSDSTVVRLTNPGSPDWTHTRIWWALRSGRATVTARYRTLEDTAEVAVK